MMKMTSSDYIIMVQKAQAAFDDKEYTEAIHIATDTCTFNNLRRLYYITPNTKEREFATMLQRCSNLVD